MTEFAIGQRWMSESENRLGLGMVVGVDPRTVSVLFPAADEQRVYALASAPLTRVLFHVGDMVKSHEGWQLQIQNIQELKGVISYQGIRMDTGESAVLAEIGLDHNISFSKPQDRLFAAQIDRNEHFELRYQALKHQQAQFQSPLRGLRGIRAGLIPHQLHIASEVGHRIAPRVLLADEVGLGKTIEAGMILQLQLFSGKVERALILVPETLQHQWLVEMLRRFNLSFSLFDEERCQDFDTCGDESAVENPFDSESLVICSLDWLVKQPQRAEQLRQAKWDLLIVDEAHHLQWSENQPSREYQLVESLAKCIAAVLLLTATPEQLGQASHFARLKLLDPERFYDYQAFIAEQKQYQPVADAVNRLLNEATLSIEEQNTIVGLLAEQDNEPLLNIINSPKSQAEQQHARQALISSLIDRHGTSRVLFRNTRQAVKGFPNRTLHQLQLILPKQYQNALKVWHALGEEVADDVVFYPEMLFQKLNPEAAWWEFDPRIEWLMTFLKNHRGDKILLICQHANTVIQLEQILREKEGIRAAIFHEKMSIIGRDKAAAYFAQQEDGAQILLSSTIGSEGRNFQFATHLVLFNLPANPDLLEQCIGRLDRIGQQQDIQIYVPFFAESSQQLLVQWYHDGLNGFEQPCPMGAALFAEHQVRLQQFLTGSADRGAFMPFVNATRQQRDRLKQALEHGRDRLLELNSNGGETAQQLARDIEADDAATDLIQFSLSLFDIIGLEQEDIGEKSIVIRPTGHMLVPDFPGIKEEGSTVTFDRQLALAREELEFLTWDHPMIRNGIDLITSGDIGKSAVSLLINKGLPAGTLLVELIYVVEVQAPPSLQLTRFLPPTLVRLLLDSKGNDLAEKVGFNALQKQLKPMGKNMANKIVKMTRHAVEQALQQAALQVAQKAQRLIDQAKAQAEQQLNEEYQRLTALQTVNKNIRLDEIATLAQLKQQSLQQLQQAGWRLDSLRLIVSNKE